MLTVQEIECMHLYSIISQGQLLPAEQLQNTNGKNVLKERPLWPSLFAERIYEFCKWKLLAIVGINWGQSCIFLLQIWVVNRACKAIRSSWLASQNGKTLIELGKALSYNDLWIHIIFHRITFRQPQITIRIMIIDISHSRGGVLEQIYK